MNCPKCGGKQIAIVNRTRKYTTAAGVGAGGYLALSSASTGAAIGTAICPGIGTVAGTLLGILFGASVGGVAGSTVGKLMDENVLRVYHCSECNHEWRAA